MKTLCHKQLHFESLFSKEVIADFEGGHITSDGGSLLLRELDKRYKVTETIAAGLQDNRCPERITHELRSLVRQRVMSIAMGYEDTNDAAKLRGDPAIKITAEKLPLSGPELASQPTLCRFENAAGPRQLHKLSQKLVDLYLKTHLHNRPVIVLDIDSTDDPTHGAQQLSFFHGFYKQHMLHPLLVFDGLTGFPLAALLRPGNVHASHRADSVLKRLIKRLKKHYPAAHPLLFVLMPGLPCPGSTGCWRSKGSIIPSALLPTSASGLESLHCLKQPERLLNKPVTSKDCLPACTHRAGSFKRPRRVIAKVECMPEGTNQRFVVTNMPAAAHLCLLPDVAVAPQPAGHPTGHGHF